MGENCKRVLISLFQYRSVVSLIMVLMNVTVHDIIHGSTSIIKPKAIYHKQSVDLVTGNILLPAVALLAALSSEASGLYQPTPIGQVVFCSNKQYTIKAMYQTAIFSV